MRRAAHAAHVARSDPWAAPTPHAREHTRAALSVPGHGTAAGLCAAAAMLQAAIEGAEGFEGTGERRCLLGPDDPLRERPSPVAVRLLRLAPPLARVRCA